jgi:hypothetical protein
MKKFIVLLAFLAVSGAVFAQVSGEIKGEIKQELINLYTSYAQSKSATERLQYIRNPESYEAIFESLYGNHDIGYSPIRFGTCGRPVSGVDMEVYALEEYVSANQRGRPIEIIQYRYFVKIGNTFKIDWEASVCYNPMTLARFNALQDGQTSTMRCYAYLTTSSYDDYFGIGIRDKATNYQFTAFIRKDSEDGLLLMEYLERGDARPVILEMKYVDNLSRYSKEVVINKFVMKGWVL